MKKWIRWWGLLAFVAVTAAIVVFWLFFVDAILRRVVERTGASMVGAEVNVASATLTFSPLGVSLSGIQVTDPQTPARNSIEIGRVAFSLDSLNLLRRKVIIREMSAQRLLFGTARKKPGFVSAPENKKEQEQKPSSFTLPSFDLPDVKAILEKEAFGSEKLIDDAKADLQKTSESWQKRVNELPNKTDFESYRARLDKIKISSKSSLKEIAASAKDAKKIKDDIDRDLDRVKKSRTALSADLGFAKELVAKAEQSPLEDIRRIRDKYSISPAGLQNMSQALFGSKITSWFDTGLLWYNRITPLVSGSSDKKGKVRVSKPLRGKGVDVKFAEHAPLPDFLIRTVNASLQPEAGAFTGTIKNITPDQDVIGAPLSFSFNGSAMKDIRSLSLSGALNHIHPVDFKDTINIQANGYQAGNMVLSGNKDMPVTIQDGLMDIEVKGIRTIAGLKATLVATFRSVRLDTGKQAGGGALLTSLKNALSRVSAFSLAADITGEPGNYDVKVTSDLDRVFRDAVGRIVREQSAKLEKELKTAVQAKTDAKLKDLKASLGGLSSLTGNIDSTQNQLTTLLQEAKKKAEGKAKLPF